MKFQKHKTIITITQLKLHVRSLHLCVLVSISSRRMNPRLVRMDRPRIAMVHVITGLQNMYVPMNRATPGRIVCVGEEGKRCHMTVM